MKVSKARSQPETAAAVFVFPYMVLGRPFESRVLIVTQLAPEKVDGAKNRDHVARRERGSTNVAFESLLFA